ncbi:hypothetical protein Ddye_025894 [Dipteronia dyeriana]|uniref:Uncharacterized protein n=1 Tax=Dipteronia dyeriana TaxID=168575 RepID=A0AAD9WNM3_9ROSI|nr:hypothetical protein Ddye_025894 [Dipteronia dyeriana]
MRYELRSGRIEELSGRNQWFYFLWKIGCKNTVVNMGRMLLSAYTTFLTDSCNDHIRDAHPPELYRGISTRGISTRGNDHIRDAHPPDAHPLEVVNMGRMLLSAHTTFLTDSCNDHIRAAHLPNNSIKEYFSILKEDS